MVYMLYQFGEYASISIDLFDPTSNAPSPIQVEFMTSQYPQEVCDSLEMAVKKSCQLLGSSIDYPIYATFDLESEDNLAVTGKSGGLSFALAIAEKLLQKDFGLITATGEVSSNGQIKAIGGINEKLESITPSLSNQNIRMFYPGDNDSEITPEIRQNLANAAITLYPVNTIIEALKILIPEIIGQDNIARTDAEMALTGEEKNPTSYKMLIMGFIMLTAVAGLAYGFYQSQQAADDSIIKVKKLAKNMAEKNKNILVKKEKSKEVVAGNTTQSLEAPNFQAQSGFVQPIDYKHPRQQTYQQDKQWNSPDYPKYQQQQSLSPYPPRAADSGFQ